MLRSNRGYIHLMPIIIIFALIGLWYAYQSYKQQRLVANMSEVFGDYQSQVMQIITDPNDRVRVQRNIDDITSVVSKYGPFVGQVPTQNPNIILR